MCYAVPGTYLCVCCYQVQPSSVARRRLVLQLPHNLYRTVLDRFFTDRDATRCPILTEAIVLRLRYAEPGPDMGQRATDSLHPEIK